MEEYADFATEILYIVLAAKELEEIKVTEPEEQKKIQYSELRPICKGGQEYESFAGGDSVYVDKTEMIFKLLTLNDKELFITRPKRFGKSLFLSTIKNMYTQPDTANFFKDTWFGAQGPDIWNKIGKHPVLHLVMPNCSDTITEFKDELNVAITRATGYETVIGRSPSAALTASILKICKDNEKNCVVLIDEYDKPLHSCLSDKSKDDYFREHVRKILHDFYQTLKDSENFIKKCIITGSARFAKTAMFTGNFFFLAITTYSFEQFGRSNI
eukprot:TRINITY_DN856_c0_g1_i5.p3 TRINITY_DN856_c0_g1~~TRINITY_DN856_c0_g1_i5.p3  ORF type:complete len:271 (-),score=15.34 TRINITY_DN856_c0_g1_i5:1193-2005(-)